MSKIIPISKIYRMSVTDYFASEGRIAQSQTVRPIEIQVVIERIVSVFFTNELKSYYFDAFFQLKKKRGYVPPTKFVFMCNFSRKHFL
jgi:hypothetical protein